jgi:hypothetical protein
VKRKLAVALLALSLATPAFAVAPLAAIVISYVKQALKERLVAYAKDKAASLVGEALSDVPGAGMLAMVPGMAAYAPRPAMSAGNSALLEQAGFNDAKAAPLSDAEWKEYEESMAMMMKAAPEGAEMPDIGEMRTAMADAPPQFHGMLRAQLRQFQQMQQERAEMQQAYARMSEAERREVVAELSKSFHELSADERPHAARALESGALGLPDDLAQRLLQVLKA